MKNQIMQKKTLYISFSLLTVLVITVIIIRLSQFIYVSDEVINIGINNWSGYDPFIFAEKQELFKENNIGVNLIRYKSAEDQIKAFREGKIKGAAVTLDEAAILHKSGFLVKAVLIIDFSMGGDQIIAQPSIKDIKSIKAKRVGYEGSLVGEFLLHRALSKNRIRLNEIELVQLDGKDWISTFRSKKIDVLVCYNPDATTLQTYDQANLLFSSKDIPHEIIDILIFEKQFFLENKGAIRKIAQAWFQSITLMKQDIETASAVICSETKISYEEYKLGLSQLMAPDLNKNKQLFDPNNKNNIYKYSQHIIDFLLEKGQLSSRLNTDDFFTNEIINNINDN